MLRLLLPAAFAAAATSALAQTETATDTAAAGSDRFGMEWSQNVRSAFIGDDNTTMRDSEEVSIRWQSLTQEERDMVMRDCAAFRTDTAAGAGGTGTETTGAGTTGAETTGTDGAASTDAGAAGTATESESGTTDPLAAEAGVDMATMTQLCNMVEGL